MKNKTNLSDNINDVKINVGVDHTGESIAVGSFTINENGASMDIIVKDEEAAAEAAEAITEAAKTVKKVSLEQLIKKKLEKDGKRTATKEIYIKSLDANLTVNNPSDTQRIEFADKAKSGSYVDIMECYSKLIYDCCPTLHAKKLQEEIGVDYPYDTVKAIFDMEEISEIGGKTLNFFDDEKENDADEKVKN